MTARILVVDDVSANVKLLEARLTAEYFDVVTAASGPEALDFVARSHCDIILLDVMMPGMDGFEVCRRIKSDPRSAHIPVIMVTALDQPSDRVRGLEAGADDFLTKPVSDLALLTRVKSLARLKMLTDELHSRATAGDMAGLAEALRDADPSRAGPGRVLVVDDRRSSFERIVTALSREHAVDVETSPQDALFKAAEGTYELVIVNIALADYDALRLCSQLRSLERTRALPILLIAEPEDNLRLMRGLDLGVNDYLLRPIDRNELLARCRTQIRRKRFTDRLRDTVQQTMELAMTDGLTGLHNRRYLDSHLAPLVTQANSRGNDLSLLIVDIDHFKAVNDTYGHDVGDDVLREFARRLTRNVRGVDIACRLGGEEFVVVMPDTDQPFALMIAERLRERIAGELFPVAGGLKDLEITVSIGLATAIRPHDTPERMLKRADVALYSAKRCGRNRVVADAA
ncbi:PleD family two-component system response regulator [Methylobrevis pamukkalensis]|uniref:diguanylate cyclase n=1 Tax=Methylobrevis pamukkalensis TaxID=1439726 RepID=A0A1E3H146_9HYPH|nr:PleD family two-component system response regulator [Methylobrevis pamukkalensis]ODN70014.1 Response regulator PleD [Methylobrevis pamukkalensis]